MYQHIFLLSYRARSAVQISNEKQEEERGSQEEA